MQIVERRRQREDKVRPRDRELSIPSVYAIAREGRRIAKVLKVFSAVPAVTVSPPDPGDPHSGPERKFRRRCFNNLSHDLMTRNQSRP
jgi:hypothetical protein